VALALRGWGPDAFARATPEFIEAARWGLYVERLGPLLAEHREVQAMTIDRRNPPSNLPAVLAAKAAADEAIPLIEAILYPEDDTDGE
jgi:hypothetical protein